MGKACAQIVESLSVGGAENLAVQIANRLEHEGWDSLLIVVGGTGPLANRIAPGVRVHFLDLERLPISNFPQFLLSIRRGFKELKAVVVNEKIGVIQSHLPGANFWGLLLTLFKVAAVIPTIHNNEEFNYGDADHPIRRRLRRVAYRLMIRRSPATVAVSGEVKASMVRELGLGRPDSERIVTVPNGVPVPPLLDEERLSAVRRKYALAEDVPLVLAAGRLCEQKNFGDLVQACHELSKRGVACQVLIAGDGPERPGLMAMVKTFDLEGRVSMPGSIQDLMDLMAVADIFALPSRWEGLPLVLLEAMATGTPVVGNAISGVVEVVEDGKTGILVEPGNVEDLATRLEALLLNPKMGFEMGSAGREMILRKYSINRVASDLAKLYESVLP